MPALDKKPNRNESEENEERSPSESAKEVTERVAKKPTPSPATLSTVFPAPGDGAKAFPTAKPLEKKPSRELESSPESESPEIDMDDDETLRTPSRRESLTEVILRPFSEEIPSDDILFELPKTFYFLTQFLIFFKLAKMIRHLKGVARSWRLLSAAMLTYGNPPIALLPGVRTFLAEWVAAPTGKLRFGQQIMIAPDLSIPKTVAIMLGFLISDVACISQMVYRVIIEMVLNSISHDFIETEHYEYDDEVRRLPEIVVLFTSGPLIFQGIFFFRDEVVLNDSQLRPLRGLLLTTTLASYEIYCLFKDWEYFIRLFFWK